MAKLIRLRGQLRFRDSTPDPRTEQSEEVKDTIDAIVPRTSGGLTPFQRVKNGTGEFFLADEAIPSRNAVN